MPAPPLGSVPAIVKIGCASEFIVKGDWRIVDAAWAKVHQKIIKYYAITLQGDDLKTWLYVAIEKYDYKRVVQMGIHQSKRRVSVIAYH